MLKVLSLLFLILDRWDSPLIEIRENEETPLENLFNILFVQKKKSKDPISTL